MCRLALESASHSLLDTSETFHVSTSVVWEAAKRLLRYVKGGVGDGLLYSLGEKVESGEMDLQIVRTKAMAADQLTKNVGLHVLVAGKEMMGMLSG